MRARIGRGALTTAPAGSSPDRNVSDLAVRAQGLSFAYVDDEYVLRDLDLGATTSTLTCVTGPSGVGKTTLLYALAGVLPVQGDVRLFGEPLPASASARARLRLRLCGFVFQRGELLAELTVVENVALPLRLLGVSRIEARDRAIAALERYGIAGCADRDPMEISSGQAQRASVARALVHDPPIVFADEPTGSLDATSRDVVVRALIDVARAGGCVIVATHDPAVRDSADQIVDLGVTDPAAVAC